MFLAKISGEKTVAKHVYMQGLGLDFYCSFVQGFGFEFIGMERFGKRQDHLLLSKLFLVGSATLWVHCVRLLKTSLVIWNLK